MFGATWRVSERLQQAVKDCIGQYHAQRAPLVPLPPIQRLGYLDEEDNIQCVKSVKGKFHAGHSYPIRTLTIQVQREGEKFNLMGGLDDVEWNGSELAFFITDVGGVERLFMDERNRAEGVKLALRATDANDGKNAAVEDKLAVTQAKTKKPKSPIEFTLQELVAHFLIPDVPDVATLKPDLLQHHLKRVLEWLGVYFVDIESAFYGRDVVGEWSGELAIWETCIMLCVGVWRVREMVFI